MEQKKPSLKEYMLQKLQEINIVSVFVSEAGLDALKAFRAESENAPRILREAVCCLIDHMPADEVKALLSAGASLDTLQEARRTHWQNLCAVSDELAENVQRVLSEASTAVEENRQIREAFLEQTDATLSWAKEQAEKLQTLQQEQIASLQQELSQERETVAELREQASKLQVKVTRMIEKSGSKTKNTSPDKQETEGMSYFERKRAKKKGRTEKGEQDVKNETLQADMVRFKEQILQQGDYNDAQIAYLLSCLSDGLTTDQIMKFAAPNYDVDVMKGFRQAWEERGIL